MVEFILLLRKNEVLTFLPLAEGMRTNLGYFYDEIAGSIDERIDLSKDFS